MANLTREQQQVLNALLAEGQRIRDPRVRNVYERAAVQTGLVESGLRNLSGGDADSAGWRQERASLYANPTNLQASARRFRQEFQQFYSPGERSWDVAAQVQRPAAQYRGRYHDVAGQAASILAKYGGGGGGLGAAPVDAQDPAQVQQRTVSDPGSTVDASNLIQLSSQRKQAATGAGNLPTPAAMAGPALPAGYQALSSGQAPKARQDIGALISASRTPGQASATVSSVTGGAPAAAGGASAASSAAPRGSGKYAGLVPLGGSKNAGKGAFAISGPQPGRLKPELTAFARKVAYVYGGKLAGSDGSTHSKYTVNGNVSEHYTGNATDIFQIGGKPAQGSVLLRAGRAALIAAGMPRAQALKAGGGLYNVGNHQIIFLTNEGGNHYDHLHISTHAGKR